MYSCLFSSHRKLVLLASKRQLICQTTWSLRTVPTATLTPGAGLWRRSWLNSLVSLQSWDFFFFSSLAGVCWDWLAYWKNRFHCTQKSKGACLNLQCSSTIRLCGSEMSSQDKSNLFARGRKEKRETQLTVVTWNAAKQQNKGDAWVNRNTWHSA